MFSNRMKWVRIKRYIRGFWYSDDVCSFVSCSMNADTVNIRPKLTNLAFDAIWLLEIENYAMGERENWRSDLSKTNKNIWSVLQTLGGSVRKHHRQQTCYRAFNSVELILFTLRCVLFVLLIPFKMLLYANNRTVQWIE